jgi:hypothetical protein
VQRPGTRNKEVEMIRKIVKVVGGRMDGKEVRSDRLAPDEEHFGNVQLLLTDDDVPVGKRFVFQYRDGKRTPFHYVVASNALEGDTRTIVLRSVATV